MEATLLKPDRGKLSPAGDVIVHIETTSSGSPNNPSKVLTIVTLVQNNVEVLNQSVSLSTFSRDSSNPLKVLLKKEGHHAKSDQSTAVQFKTAESANEFLLTLCEALGSELSEVQVEKSGLYAHTGSQGPHLLTVNRGPSSLSSSIHSNVSDLSHSGTSSGYCSHYWSEVSTSSQLVDGEDTLAPHTHLPSIESESASSASTQTPPEEEKCQKCRYCSKQFAVGLEDTDSICPLAPNNTRATINRLCCLQCYKGCWYHLTKDSLDAEGQDLGKCQVDKGMTISHWCLLGCVSVLCLPCLMLWCPLSLCEYAAQSAGMTGGPHVLTTVKKKGQTPSKKSNLKEKIIVDAPVDEGIEIDDGSNVHIKVEQTSDPIVEVSEAYQDSTRVQRHHSAQVIDMEHKKPNIQRSQSDCKK